MKIAMLTGGGDCPGLNSALKGLTLGALQRGWEVVGLRRGWESLLHINPREPESLNTYTQSLDAESVRKVDRDGGTFLHTSRTNPSNVTVKTLPTFLRDSSDINETKPGVFDCTNHVLNVLNALGIDVLFPIGGDDTLSYGNRLHQEGFPVIGIPKTMDNDVHGTEYCLGFATCVARSVEYLHNIRTSAGSHERFAVIEVLGRNAGFTALIPAYLGSADHALIAEVPFDMDHLTELMLASRAANPSQYSVLLVSEGAHVKGGAVVEGGEADAFGHRKLGGIGKFVADTLKEKTGIGIIYQNLGYLVRCGRPDPVDVMATFNFTNLAIDLAARQEFGRLIRVHEGRYDSTSMSIVGEGIKRVDVGRLYDVERYTPHVTNVAGLPFYL